MFQNTLNLKYTAIQIVRKNMNQGNNLEQRNSHSNCTNYDEFIILLIRLKAEINFSKKRQNNYLFNNKKGPI